MVLRLTKLLLAGMTAPRRKEAGALDARRQQSILAEAFAPAWFARHDYRLLARFGLVNLAAFALLGAAYARGWIHTVVAADPANLCAAIVGVFVVGFFVCGWRICRLSRELSALHAPDPNPASRVARYLILTHGRNPGSRAILASSLKLKLSGRVAFIRYVANTLVFLGLTGTVVGCIIALSGVTPDASVDASRIAPMIATLSHGLSAALLTTLVGAVLNIWLMANYYLLATGTTTLLSGLVERGENNVER